ncbi:MAG: hypothetical protein IJV41_00705 [Oscillospiraceae bacterium]|nr:hypothetical protein [Oscillospiraceae bacterium]
MTVSTLDTALRAAAPGKIFELAAPEGATEYAVWHEYAPRTLTGDDAVQLEAPRVQIDVIWQRRGSTLLRTVKDTLTALELPYEVISHGYDDAWSAMRCILQLEVV